MLEVGFKIGLTNLIVPTGGVLRDWVWQKAVMCDVMWCGHSSLELPLIHMSHAHSLAQRNLSLSLCHKWSENEEFQGPVSPITISWWGKWPKLPKFDQLTHHRRAVSPELTLDHETDNRGDQGKWQDKYIFRSGIFYTGGCSASKASPLSLAKLWVNVFIFISPHQSFLTARGWRYLGLNIATNIWLARFLDKPTFV